MNKIKPVKVPNPEKLKKQNNHSLTIEEMASRIAAIRPSYPYLSINPLTGNSLY